MGILDAIELIKIPSFISNEKLTSGNAGSTSISEMQLGQVFDDIFRNYLIYINKNAQKQVFASTLYRGNKLEKFKPSKENIRNHIQQKFRKNTKLIENETELIYSIIKKIDYSKFIASEIIYIDKFLGSKDLRMVDKFGFRNPRYILKPDIIVNETIIDIKFTDKVVFTPEYFYQLILYFIWIEYLNKENINNATYQKLKISKLGIFFPKKNILCSFMIKDIIPEKVMDSFLDYWFSLIDCNYPFLRKFVPLLFAFKKDPNFINRKRKVDQFTSDYIIPQLKFFSSKILRGETILPDLEKIVLELISEILEVKYRTIDYTIIPHQFLLDSDVITLGYLNYLKCNFNAHSKYLEQKIDSVSDKLIYLVEAKIHDRVLRDLIIKSGLEYSKIQKMNKENFISNQNFLYELK